MEIIGKVVIFSIGIYQDQMSIKHVLIWLAFQSTFFYEV